ncbi:MAG: MotA/TolQ/ExbB proton channel family protein [Kiritimatiellae bacterium]|nr:MotA/TolQ/ExbB proton channel family protein [Kiritimatiellia bacterium]
MAEKDLPESLQQAEEMAPGRATRPTTDTNIVIQLLVGLVGMLVVMYGVVPLKGTNFNYVWAIIRDRGPVQYFEVFMAFMIAAFIFMKSRIVRGQLGVIAEGPVDPTIDLNDDEQIQDLRKSIMSREEFSWSIVMNRVDRMMALWLGSKDVSRVAAWSSAESERDTTASDSSYAVARVLIWAIPILGFIGTVQGLGQAVSGFADFLAGAAELSQIKEAIGNVTIGLGVAFDTTFLALILSTLLMFPLSFVQRREENLFVEIDNYLDDSFVSRLPSPEQQPIVIENLEDSIEAAFRRYIPDPDRYDEVFTRSIEKASGVVEERFASLAKGYEVTLQGLAQRLSATIGTVGDQLEGTFHKVLSDLQAQEDKMLSARRQAGDDELGRFKTLVEQIHGTADQLAAGYRKNADDLRTATLESAQQSVAAAEKLAGRLEEVGRLAAGIEDLLRIQEAVTKGLEGIASSEEFRKTMQDLRGHLATTDAFCNRLSKPRVITLREEPGR